MGELRWRYGSMSSGKSAALLMANMNYRRVGVVTKLVTAAVDDRFGRGRISSRMGLSEEADVFSVDTKFDMDFIGLDVRAVLIDEAQFLTGIQVRDLHRMAALNELEVTCFGLRSDFQGNGFEGAAALGVLADRIEQLWPSVCECGRDAVMNVRIDEGGVRIRVGEQVQIGARQYKSICQACFYCD